MSSPNEVEGIYISNPIGRLGNHIITIMNAVYMSDLFNYKWIALSDEYKAFPKLIDVENKKVYLTRDNVDITNFRKMSGFLVFHISHYLGKGREKLDFNKYKSIYQEYFPLLASSINKAQFEFNKGIEINLKHTLSYHENKTLYTHLKFTDNLQPNLHFKYNVLPINLYIKLITDYKFDVLVVVSDTPNNNYLDELRSRVQELGKHLEVVHGHIWNDFTTLVNAKYIVMDMSTFTWTAHLVSPKQQYIFMWPLFFTRFLAKWRHYVDIMLFNDKDIISRENYCFYNLSKYPECGEWYATEPHLQLMINWDSSNLIILTPDRISTFNQSRNKPNLDLNEILAKYDEKEPSDDIITSDDTITPDDIVITDNEIAQQELITSRKIALVGPGIMEIPPKGWGAVEILIWEYYQELTRLGWDVDIINTKDTDEIIRKINRQQSTTAPYAFVHLHYDRFYTILNKLEVPHIALTSHYPYIDKPEKHDDDGYTPIFNFLTSQTKYYNVMLSQKDTTAIIHNGASKNKIRTIRNGANQEKFQFIEECEYPENSICLGWITTRKRQSFLQKLPELNIYFAGRPEDPDFNYNSPYYLGEWTKDEVYSKMTKYSNLVLLSGGETDPLVVKEAMMAGIGIVINQTSAAHLIEKPWITLIPTDKETDLVYIKDAILKNREISIKPEIRKQIRQYAEEMFSNTVIVKEYSDWLNRIISPKPKVVLVGTGISAIPAKGWGACEGIIWEYYQRLNKLGYPVIIANDENKNYRNMIDKINNFNADIVHIMYDDRIDLLPFIKTYDNRPRIIYTSHWGYLPQIEKKRHDPYTSNIFNKAILARDKVEYFVLSDEIKDIYIKSGVPEYRIKVVHNGADESMRFVENVKYPDRVIYLAKIDYRKRQYLFQSIKNIYFAGNIADGRFNKDSSRYLGEWTRQEVYRHLTDYCSLALLSDGDADPLTTKEGLMAGCGLILSEYATANLDLSKKWITVIPEDKIKDIEYVEKAIKENIELCRQPRIRMEIRKYAEEKFSWSNIIWNNYLKEGLGVL